ncbi:MAG: FtsX-like permease family protein [Mycobacteriales bacterium]
MRESLRLALRGIWARRGVSVAILLVAAVTVATAAAGPIWRRAAGESVLSDHLAEARGIASAAEISMSGSVASAPGRPLGTTVQQALASAPTMPFSTALRSIDNDDGLADGETKARLAWRENACQHVRLVAGRCPQASGEVMVSRRSAAQEGWRVGGRVGLLLAAPDPAGFQVSGLYDPVDPLGRYWSIQSFLPAGSGQAVDALFTTEGTMNDLAPNATVRAVLELALDPAKVRLVNADAVRATVARLRTSTAALLPNAHVDSTIETTLAAAGSDRDKLDLPVLLVVAQLLALCLVVLLLVVGGAVEARGPEVALAKLRGLPTGATLAFGLLELLLLLALALPLGLGAAWLSVRLAVDVQLVQGTPVILTPGALAAAAFAFAAAALACAAAARGMLTRPVLAELRKSARRPTRRSAALDVAVGAVALAGLAELSFGRLEPGRVDVLSLLAPGLLTLAAALLGARLLPHAIRLLLRPTRAGRRIGLFLAVRQVARRPAALRAVLVVAVAFGLASFGVDAWSVARVNRHDRALADVGAATVLRVQTPALADLSDLVRRAAPDGTAMAVTRYFAGNGSVGERSLLAVDSSRFARAAYWRSDFADVPAADLASRLTPSVAAPVQIRGSGVGVVADAIDFNIPVRLVAEVQRADGFVRSEDLGPLDGRTHRATFTGCDPGPCRLRAVRFKGDGIRPVAGSAVLLGVEELRGAAWRRLDTAFSTSRWRPADAGSDPVEQLRAAGAGLKVTVSASSGAAAPGIGTADVPTPIPAVVTAKTGASSGGQTVQVPGLDGQPLAVRAVTVARALPSLGDDGAIVDRTYALRSAQFQPGYGSYADDEVWLAPNAPTDVAARLATAGVRVLGQDRAADREAQLSRQGPALALGLLLAAGVVAVLLAAGGGVLTLVLLGRRRRYEMAALRLVRVRRSSLLGALLVEQALLLGSGAVLGVLAGLLGARVAVRSVPLYADNPTAPPYIYGARPLDLLAFLGTGGVVVVLAVVVAAAVLLRHADAERLREAAP